MQSIEIIKTSITDVKTDIIVNAANEKLLHGSGVCGYIFEAAGPKQLQDACNRIGHCDTGSAVITPGFNLSKYIVHAVGPVWHGGKNNEPQKLYGCYKASLDLAKDNACHSIGFPLISSGIFGYPVDKAWTQALQAVKDWFKENPEYDIRVIFAILADNIIASGKTQVLKIAPRYFKEQNTTRSSTQTHGRSGKF